MKKTYLLHGHYTINSLRYLTINHVSGNKSCINKQLAVTDNNHLTELLIEHFKNDFSNLKWFWCITHSAFINILEQAGARCIFRLNYLNYNISTTNLYRYWKNSNCDTCNNHDSCCIHQTKEKSSNRHTAYICIFIIKH